MLQDVEHALVDVQLTEVVRLSCNSHWRLRVLALPHQQIPHLHSHGIWLFAVNLRKVLGSAGHASNESYIQVHVTSSQMHGKYENWLHRIAGMCLKPCINRTNGIQRVLPIVQGPSYNLNHIAKSYVSWLRAFNGLLSRVLNDEDVGVFHAGKRTSALCSKAYCAKALAPFLNSEMLPTYELWNQVVMC